MLFMPKTRVIEAGGIKTPIDPDFRIMCDYGAAALRKDKKALSECAGRFFFAGLPDGVGGGDAAAAMNNFYLDGLAPDRKKEKSSAIFSVNTPAPSFDFEEDEVYFYAAFLSEYGIDLNSAVLHWLDFCALFRGLPDECRLKRIIGIRAENLSEIRSKSEKARVKKLKKLFALKCAARTAPVRYATVKERDEALLRMVNEQFEAAKKALEEVREK